MTVFLNAKLVYPDKIREGAVIVKDGKIAGITERFDSSGGGEVIDCKGLYLILLHGLHQGNHRSAVDTAG